MLTVSISNRATSRSKRSLYRLDDAGLIGLLTLLFTGVTSSAHGNWAYTSWGMTLDQVIAASAGTVHALSLDKRTRNDSDNWEIAAEGTYLSQSLPALSTGFMFDTRNGGLICVLYNMHGAQSAELTDALEKQYGRPAEQSEFGTARSSIWHTSDDIELVVNQRPLAAAVTHCQPGR